MNVFSTKEGRVYKVSLKSFTTATGKKTPYYKRIKKDGKFVEKAYAICPGCGNPVHFVNLFNGNKKKKAHTRHQRSSIKGLAKYSASGYRACPYVKRETEQAKFSKTDTAPTNFVETMVEALGFSNNSVQLLAKIYLELQNSDPENADQKFFALMASASYNNLSLEFLFKHGPKEAFEQFWKGLAWNGVGAIDHYQTAKNYIIDLGFDSNEVNSLFDELDMQHGSLEDAASPYFHKLDFTHLCATAATNLCDTQVKIASDFGAGMHNGIFSTDANAGYIGDLCGTDGTSPSMNRGDYEADLDAVNIIRLLRKNPDTSLLSVMRNYLEGTRSGKINRAKEFKKSISIDTLHAQKEAYKTRLEQIKAITNNIEGPFLTFDDEYKEAELKERLDLFDKFIDCIEHSRSEWPDE